jgi:hypothetical protein
MLHCIDEICNFFFQNLHISSHLILSNGFSSSINSVQQILSDLTFFHTLLLVFPSLPSFVSSFLLSFLLSSLPSFLSTFSLFPLHTSRFSSSLSHPFSLKIQTVVALNVLFHHQIILLPQQKKLKFQFSFYFSGY